MGLDSGIALLTLAEAKTYLNVPADKEDTIIQSLLNSVSGIVRSYLGRDLVKAEKTEYYHGTGEKDLMLLRIPIVSVSTVHVDSLRTWGATSLIASSNYLVMKRNGVLKAVDLYGAWPCGDANIRVVYTAGYDISKATESEGGLPHGIRLAVGRLLDLHYRSGFTQRKLDVSSESVGDHNTTFTGGSIPKDVREMLDPFRSFLTPAEFSHGD